MNWRWLQFDYVDPALGLSRQERKAIRQRAYHTTWLDSYRQYRPKHWWAPVFALNAALMLSRCQEDECSARYHGFRRSD